MASIYLTLEEIENLFRAAALKILGLPEDDNKSVRFPFGSAAKTGNAPGITRDKDVCFIYIIPADDGYGQQHHISYIPEPGNEEGLLTRVDEHTDIYEVRFVCYGPNSFEKARSIKDGFYRNDIRQMLKQGGFFLKAGIPPISHVHEIKESEWWMRHDVSPTFYSYVRIETPNVVGPIEHVTITYPH